MDNQIPKTIEQKKAENRQYQAFNPKPTLLLNVADKDSRNTIQSIQKQNISSNQETLQGFLNTEASARKLQLAKRKWQILTFMLEVLLIGCLTIIGWLYLKANITEKQHARMLIENQQLIEQSKIAGLQISGFKDEMDKLINRNIELVNENAKLKSQSSAPVVSYTAKKPEAIDTSRVEDIKKGIFSNGTTKDALIAALGEPDRIYNSNGYEQLVYFGKKPGRFWLIEGHLFQTSD